MFGIIYLKVITLLQRIKMEIPTTICSTNLKKGSLVIINMNGKQITYAIVLNNNKSKKILSIFCYNRKLKDINGPEEIEWQTIITYQQLDKYLGDNAYDPKVIL